MAVNSDGGLEGCAGRKVAKARRSPDHPARIVADLRRGAETIRGGDHRNQHLRPLRSADVVGCRCADSYRRSFLCLLMGADLVLVATDGESRNRQSTRHSRHRHGDERKRQLQAEAPKAARHLGPIRPDLRA